MDNRPASEYAQSGSHFPYPNPPHPPPPPPPPPVASAHHHSELPAADQASAAATAQYTPQPEVRPNPQYTPQPEVRPAANISSNNTPQSDYGLNQPPTAARSPAYPEYLARPPQYHHAPNTQAGGAAGMAQATSPSMNTLTDGPHNDHRNHHSNVKSDPDVPIDPSIAASSPTYPPPYSPYQPQGHDMAQYQGHPPPPPPQMYARPEWSHGYGQHQHGLPGPYNTPATTVGPASPAATAGPRPGQVYSFVPIPGAQQHKRPRRRYEEIERMYKCGWNGCEKAYGTLNHLNAHVTMQSHGAKRTPEEFKEIRKEWKARKKEEEAQRKAAEERERAAAAQAAQAAQVDAPNPADPGQPGQPPAYPGGVRPQLPPIGYQPADGQVPGQYGGGAGGMVYQGNGQMGYPPNYPHSPYGQSSQVYQQHVPSSLSLGCIMGQKDPLLEQRIRCGSCITGPGNIKNSKLDASSALAGLSSGTAKVSAKVVEMELKWLKDPRALADRIGMLLQADNIGLAAEIVRVAQSEKMECAVAWNHLIEYCMNKKNSAAAFKFYNDMKKRGRKPNSRTYTIMLNGLTKEKHPAANPVRNARNLYKSIFSEFSTVKPEIIHSNAMLNVCASHGDMDTMWEIAGELPEDGPGSPDSVTYTIILRAIKDSAHRDLARLEPNQAEKIFSRKVMCVNEGKRIWSDIVYRWKRGQLVLDNTLVGTMASVLLEGPGDHHFWEVFQLYHQTAGIQVLAKEPPPDTPRRSVRESLPTNSFRTRKEIDDVPFVDEGGRLYQPSEPEADPTEEEAVSEENFEKLFAPVVPEGTIPTTTLDTSGTQPSGPAYIALGNRELSMILETCLTMNQALSVGKTYWQDLTQGVHAYRIEPDVGSFHQYLRLLRRGRSSRATVEVVRDQMVPAHKADGRTFHIALSCCRRDRKNMNVLKNANELLKAMEKAIVLPDPRVLEGYLELIRSLEESPLILMSLNGLDVEEQRRSSDLAAMGRRLQLSLRLVAVENLRPLIAKLDEAMEHGHVSRASSKGPGKKPSDRQKVPGDGARKALIGMRMLIDSILKSEGGKLLKKVRQQLEKESNDLRKYSKTEVLTRYNNSLVSPTPEQVLAHRGQENDDSSPASGDNK
ncbi:hypothetical protein P175DRAFT_0510603 [Aspergillus ochraceoroseus IBT 24754]|uniref:C2H2-type domain-containing protein n=1 Tax=Aspergillus ochraceoroseus IBT 24754 TaxID=1392256 RepID=A0A2T5LSS5_9EURO|nr:uncharacterized protein P175DRAFT_0510603 [Aspergillus ochraceoroseus IBT 24754]PTU19335.1 hypothetical protein P175DRAFT_0510603 [Aspergillus ochraceoroseus IBT 24754]